MTSNGSEFVEVLDSPGAEDSAAPRSPHQQMTEEFNVQRAKMKELFLQKEDEVRRVGIEKQQLESEVLGLRAQLQQLETLSQNQKSEIETLQLLVHETVEASGSACAGEVRRLQTRCLELEQQLNLLNKQQSQEVSLAPGVLVQAVTKSIARKLGGDPGPDSLDDSMRKAQEDSEFLRSLVVPLEEEIHVLKDKLRETDHQLQVAMANKKVASAGDTKDAESACDMCANYEAQLVTEQSKCDESQQRARKAELALKMATEELEQAASVHADTLASWQSERRAATEQLSELRARVTAAERTLEAATAAAAAANCQALDKVTKLTVHRQTLQEKLNSLQSENDLLVGKYAKKAMELQTEDINVPNNLEELQEYTLRLREELIVASTGREAALAAEEALRGEMLAQGGIMRDQLNRYSSLSHAHHQLRQKLELLETEREQINALGNQLRTSDSRLNEALEARRRLLGENAELRLRVSSLQQELDNSEKVQQDFVRLSQSLQVQLERIREADTEVRWQHEEDVSECPACRAHLPTSKRKVHCRHCGRIFCSACVAHSVPSGPRATPARVCSVCRTLLQRHTAPYFSTEAPHSPD